MAERIVCPKCSRASYTTAPEVYGPCPYCGFIFNWRSPERRVFVRSKTVDPMILEVDGEKHNAEVVNISKRGLGIVLSKPPVVQTGDRVKCTIKKNKEETKDTKVVWFEESEGSQKVGLLYLT
jgi:hypothetical protein